MPLVLAGLMTTFGNLTHPDIWPMNEDTRVIEVLNKGLQQIIMGRKTPEQVAKETQNKKEKILKKWNTR